ncbi:hypothetical protein AAFF_G00372030 [Aldrovandia affinis]|uniref:Uncharacterized protein n=1 Tax=Aldrovandia affinis TaxID=143900 RepID=A0AAD7VYH2_9TELE|nr:hypothetical protein AAFF_G00372030 [Aldrovandia affinis]
MDGQPSVMRRRAASGGSVVLAHGSSFKAALVALQHMLERVAPAGLKLHPEKCHFMQREVVFLGHKWLMLFKEPEGQVTHWIEELQAYDFTVVHRAGACHTNVDALSRHPCTADGCHYCEQKEAQERDLILERVGEVVYRVQLPPTGRKVALHRDRLALYRGALPHHRPRGPR